MLSRQWHLELRCLVRLESDLWYRLENTHGSLQRLVCRVKRDPTDHHRHPDDVLPCQWHLELRRLVHLECNLWYRIPYAHCVVQCLLRRVMRDPADHY